MPRGTQATCQKKLYYVFTPLTFSMLGCPLGYKMVIYHQFKELNSQIAEQKDSKLAWIKAQLSSMSHVNFIQHAQLFL